MSSASPRPSGASAQKPQPLPRAEELEPRSRPVSTPTRLPSDHADERALDESSYSHFQYS
jgi:hypothetical protein